MERDHGHHIDQRGKSFSLADHYSWPHPQIRLSSPSTSYSCCYCKRKFRSPQGLGGHMNVHRWDRARRIHGQCSAHRLASPLNNPSPNGRVIDLSLAKMPHHTGDDDGSAAAVTKTDVCHFTSSASSTVTKDFKVKNFESGTGVHSHHDDGTEDRLDLELRLGCS